MNQRDKFIEDLRNLLEKYGAEITADDHWEGYVECGRDIRMTVEFDDMRTPYIELGKYLSYSQLEDIQRG